MLFQPELFTRLEPCQRILLAGIGGGFDVYTALPLYLNLRRAGKTVFLANLSFTWLEETTSREIFPGCWQVLPGDRVTGKRNYFPEKHLVEYLIRREGNSGGVYAFPRMGPAPLSRLYTRLAAHLQPDAVVLVDGGTDSLMRGDEAELGTPQEDISSMIAAMALPGLPRYLCCAGFGVDTYHGVSHALYLENVAAVARNGGYLGTFSWPGHSPEMQAYRELMAHANTKMPGMESIVSNCISLASEGQYGHVNFSSRLQDSEVYISPLSDLYWCFELEAVMRQNLYWEAVRDLEDIGSLNTHLNALRRDMPALREYRKIPL